MTKAEAFIAKLEAIKTPENSAIVEGIEKGFNLILEESRRRAKGKALTESIMKNYGKKLTLTEGFNQLDMYRKQSGMSNKVFVESVGRTVLESMLDDETKDKLLSKLGEYSNALNEGEQVVANQKVPNSGCLYAMVFVDDAGKKLLAEGKTDELLHRVVMPKAKRLEGEEADKAMTLANGYGEGNTIHIGMGLYEVKKKLIDSPYEKYYIVGAEKSDYNTMGDLSGVYAMYLSYFPG